ncbi:FAD binding protein [Fragilaria crotonensis]|nr:FAD binding protein [Fragilaria crotonensis]
MTSQHSLPLFSNVLFALLLLAAVTVTNGFVVRSGNCNVGNRNRVRTQLLATQTNNMPLEQLKIAVVGGGPSGLLLAHKLLASGATVNIYEGRTDPRSLTDLEGRAYALGLGMRGRTAIRSVDNALWEAVKARGYESERFTLYLRGFPIKLRDSAPDGDLEPSVLTYQSDLCSALLDELIKRDHLNGKLSVEFKQATTAFQCQKDLLPGDFKTCRLETTPEQLDPTSVALIIPNAGSTTCFVEPTATGCCLLFAGPRGGNDDPILNPPANLTVTTEALKQRFPLLEGSDLEEITRQLASQPPSSASSVQCNVYHYGHVTALCGDAAHATGGVSGQGVNSALVDAIVLAESLDENFDPSNRLASLQKALLRYSQRQVPEGKALYDLSFGPKPTGVRKVQFLFQNVLDTLFQGRLGIGRPPLQTILTTSTKPFAEVRRERDAFYDEPFLDQGTFDAMLAKIYND